MDPNIENQLGFAWMALQSSYARLQDELKAKTEQTDGLLKDPQGATAGLLEQLETAMKALKDKDREIAQLRNVIQQDERRVIAIGNLADPNNPASPEELARNQARVREAEANANAEQEAKIAAASNNAAQQPANAAPEE